MLSFTKMRTRRTPKRQDPGSTRKYLVTNVHRKEISCRLRGALGIWYILRSWDKNKVPSISRIQAS